MLEIYDVPDAIKKSNLFFVNTLGTLIVKYRKNGISSIDQESKDDYKDSIYIFNTKDDCGAYCLLNVFYNKYIILEQNFFIILIDDYSKFKDSKDALLKSRQDILTKNKLMYNDSYHIMESPELYKIIDQWYYLTKHDYSQERYIIV